MQLAQIDVRCHKRFDIEHTRIMCAIIRMRLVMHYLVDKIETNAIMRFTITLCQAKLQSVYPRSRTNVAADAESDLRSISPLFLVAHK